MVTPFDDAGALDLDAAAALARWLVDHGSDGLVVAGTTGEGPVLTDAEQLDLWRAVAEAVDRAGHRRHRDQRHRALDRAHQGGRRTGVDGVLVVTPYYNRPSQAGSVRHFRAVAAATELPVVLYDIPVRTGRRIAADTMLRLATEVAERRGGEGRRRRPGSARPGSSPRAAVGFELYCGDDALTLPLLSVGAVGVVSVASHWAGPRWPR